MSLSNAAESTHNLLIRVQRANPYNLRSPRKLAHGQPRESVSNSMDFLPSYAEALSDTRLELYPSLRAEPSNTSSSSILPSFSIWSSNASMPNFRHYEDGTTFEDDDTEARLFPPCTVLPPAYKDLRLTAGPKQPTGTMKTIRRFVSKVGRELVGGSRA